MSTQQHSMITDEMRAAIGVESEPVIYEVEKSGCRMVARAVGYTDPIFYDEAAAKAAGFRGIVAPPFYLGTRIYVPGDPEQRGGVNSRVLSEASRRGVNGGNEIEYFDVICAGDILTATTKLVSVRETEGSLHRLLIQTREMTFRNQEGKVVAVRRNTGISW
jgi:acyl dehydratase